MDVAVLGSALVLAAVFAVAGAAKLADRSGSRAAARSFGVPARLSGAVATGLPILELAVAVLLLLAGTRTEAAIGALVLLLGFSTAIGAAMTRGEAPDCHCFGQLHSEPAGWKALARNAILGALASFVAVAGRDDPGAGAFAWTGRIDGLEWLALALAATLVAVVAMGGLVVLHLTRRYGWVLTRLDRAEERLRAAGLDVDDHEEMPQLGLAPGTEAPQFSLKRTGGGRVALSDLLARGRPVLLVFTSPTCGQCSMLMPRVAAWQREHHEDVVVALVSGGKPALVREETAGLDDVLLDTDLGVYERYDVNGTPSAVLVADDGTIAAWTAAGADWIETLFAEAVGGLGRTPGLPIGSETPAEVAGAVTGPTAVLFWNDACGFCESIRDDVAAWVGDPPAGAPALLVVSAESTELGTAVIRDPDWKVASTLGADGTPMAVLVDGDGRIASPLASGAPAVLDLLGIRELSAAG